MQDISAFGLRVRLTASSTFPTGLDLTQFASDADPLDVSSIQLAETEMGLNGDLVSFSRATPITVTVNVIPNSPDDQNLSALADANRVASGKRSALDTITLVAVYPSGSSVTYRNGKLTDAMPGIGIASAGRMKSKAYIFKFEDKVSN